ncbi:AlbA family DNA-binding domain-containing protein [Faecalibacterium prausnitzii]|uniref:AlbA family DNA-binding domain-containing protein n=1 Tax=Faecalibacterium prausnitzii TaxID=853 RepID=UPI0018CC65A4|nr:ATP-binding protein [Faecalibacterium prausnitzii]
MVNINGKPWEELQFKDVQDYLSDPDSNENCFFEYKIDKVEPAKLVKEISAFANTYGGYIFLGVDDNKNIVGCTAWDEQRIHITIHNGITPTPQFDVKCFSADDKIIYVIKIEEGAMPPYITNKGDICERVSSGSCVVTESGKLNQMYHKQENQLIRIKNKIELPEIKIESTTQSNVFAYLDFGFSIATSSDSKMREKFNNANLKAIGDFLRSFQSGFSISLVGTAYLFSIGTVIAHDMRENQIPAEVGCHNFMEVMRDGSVRGRVVLVADSAAEYVDVKTIMAFMDDIYPKVYSMIFGDDFSELFIHAYQYEKFTVVKQFVPIYDMSESDSKEIRETFEQYLPAHRRKYGNNIMIIGGRIPRSDYQLIDRRLLEKEKVEYNSTNLYRELFYSFYKSLGYIDTPAKAKD